MPSKKEDVVQPNLSPVLFMTVEGEPMSFFLRPGAIKRKLQPLITAGGGMLCNVQQPGAILLLDAEERVSIPESTAHWYLSTQYIYDCIEKNEQLDLENYRLNPGVVQRQSVKLNSSKDNSPGLSGRVAYTPEDDAAMLNYVSKHKTETGGNRLWQEMEKQGVTGHSWQSMKYRYRVRLAKKQMEAVEVETAEEDNKTAEVEENQETDVQRPSSEEDALPPQIHAAETDQTQIDDQAIPEGGTPENRDVQTSICPQEEEQHVKQQTDEQAAESTQAETVEAVTSDRTQTEGPWVDLQTDTQLLIAETTEPERDGALTTVSPQKQSVPEDSLPARPEPSPQTSTSKKLKEKHKASPQLDEPQCRMTRRRLVLEAASSSPSSEPYGKKLRSSSNSAERPASSPQPSRKTKSAATSALQKDTATDQPPSKKARGKSVAAAESQQEQSGHAAVSETPPADESESILQKAGQKKGKRKLGILELAAKEFEDESESDDDEAPDLQNFAGTATTSTEALHPPSHTAADPTCPQSNPEPAASLQEDVQQAQTSSSIPERRCPKPETAAQAAVSEAVDATCKAHLFIFDHESQEEDSQSIFGCRPAAPSNTQPTANNDAALSLTQGQLEEDKQRIRELMNQTDQNLVSVTKAMLKTSGDFSSALNLLLNPSSVSGPFWSRHDDSLLLSADPVIRQHLQEKYGEEDVAKRIMFLEMER
ncbi:telomeric repeat-binding factor 2-interacting protein 1 [Brachyistius frenatus]|uniref:telomeric repeat-binding factor 2-interacting protein 1 n=1 Tax=Brachyistius frenatus TaxID=100188 RepID=UPI0037E967F5